MPRKSPVLVLAALSRQAGLLLCLRRQVMAGNDAAFRRDLRGSRTWGEVQMHEQDVVTRALVEWRADIDSVRFPDLLCVEAAVAVVVAARRRGCRGTGQFWWRQRRRSISA